MPIDTLDKVVTALTGAAQSLPFSRASGTVLANTAAASLLLNYSAGTSFVQGFPGPSGPPASPATLAGGTSPSPGFHQTTNPGSGLLNHLALAAVASSQSGILEIYDILAIHRPVNNGSNSNTTLLKVPDSPDPRNYDGGRGVEAFVHLGGTSNGVDGTVSINYTNSDGVSGQTSPTLVFPSALYNTGTLRRIPLAAGHQGVRSITSIARAGTGGGNGWTSTDPGVLLARRLAMIFVGGQGQGTVFDYAQLGLANVPANAALGFVFTPGTMVPFDLSANLRLITG